MSINKNKILIVDDEELLRIGLIKCIGKAGYDAIEAKNGIEALDMTEKHSPGLILLDVMMRGMSGLEVCRTLKKDPEKKHIKIIILSAKGQLREQEEGFEAGADSYITKPFKFKELLNTIHNLLESQ